MTTSSRNAAIRNMAERDGEEETKAYVKQHYGLDPSLTTWKEIDDAAYAKQKQANDQWNKATKPLK